MPITFACEASLSYSTEAFTCHKFLRHGTNVLACPPQEILLRIFIALEHSSSSTGFELTNLGSNVKHDNNYTTDNNHKISYKDLNRIKYNIFICSFHSQALLYSVKNVNHKTDLNLAQNYITDRRTLFQLLSVRPSVSPSLFVCLLIYMSVHLSVCLSVYSLIHTFACLSISN
jgi:hypothetical protein